MKNYDIIQKIRLYDGYQGEDIWKQPENKSVYYDYEIDSQCKIPIKDEEELLKELCMLYLY